MTLELFGPPPAPPPAPVLFSSYLGTSTPDSVNAQEARTERARRIIRLPRRAPRGRADAGTRERFQARTREHEAHRQLVVDALTAAINDLDRRLPDDDHAWLVRHRVEIESCSDAQAFRHVLCGQFHIRPYGCGSRACPPCERRRAGDVIERIDAWLATVPAHDASYTVLPLRNVHDLKAGYKLLSDALARLRRRAIWKGGKCRQRRNDGRPWHPCHHREHPHARDLVGGRNCPRARHRGVVGDVCVDEVTTHECDASCSQPCPWVGSWHPHTNVLMHAPYIPQAELSDAWREVTCPTHEGRGCPPGCRDGSYVMWIQRIRAGTVREAVKYVTKPSTLVSGDDPWLLVDFLLASRGRRLLRTHGSAYGIAFERDEDDRAEQCVLWGETIAFRAGKPIRRRYRLPRFPDCCGRDSVLANGEVAWELPVAVSRADLELDARGRVTWRPRARAPG